MTNISQIFGTVMLSLILMTGSLYAFAQDDDDEEKEELEEEQQDESKEEEAEEEDESKEEEQPEGEQQITNETIQETAQQIIQTELDKAGITSTNESQPIMNLSGDHTLNYAQQQQPVANDGMQFDATCNCTTTTPIKSTTSSQQPIMQPINPTPNNNVIEQIPITSSNILSSKSLGKVVDPAYTNYYTVSNLFDNKINDVSFWSQAGNSGFTVQLDQTLDGYQVCSIELNGIHNPKNVPYLLDVGVSKNYTGVIDQTNERIQFDSCVKNMDQILMIFNDGNLVSNDFISIAELKLLGSKLGGGEGPPTPQQPPSQGPYKNATKINISNSEAAIDIKNSTITLKFDKNAAQASNYNVITIPDANVVK